MFQSSLFLFLLTKAYGTIVGVVCELFLFFTGGSEIYLCLKVFSQHETGAV